MAQGKWAEAMAPLVYSHNAEVRVLRLSDRQNPFRRELEPKDLRS